MKIVVLDGNTVNPGDLDWKELEAIAPVTVYPRSRDEEVAPRIGDAEIALTNKSNITAQVMDACPHLRYIGVLATGYNVVDIPAAKARNIIVTNIPTYGTQAVAQFTMALLLEVCHHVGAHSQAVHNGRWINSQDFCFWETPLMELSGKTMGLLGLGRIGTAVAKLAGAFGMRVVAYSRSQQSEGEQVAEYLSLEQVLAQADVLSLHMPLTPETQGMVNRDFIAKMKPGAILLNTARGGLLQEADVARALQEGRLRAAAVDVVSEEPMRADNPLLGAENCIITPHIAWASKESRGRLMGIAVENVRQFLAGTPVHVVSG